MTPTTYSQSRLTRAVIFTSEQGHRGRFTGSIRWGKKAELVYDSPDKNILSLAVGPDGFIYAGSDSRGLIYRINPRTKEAKVLYDSEQQEITALLFCGEDLYAAATSANIVQAEARFAAERLRRADLSRRNLRRSLRRKRAAAE